MLSVSKHCLFIYSFWVKEYINAQKYLSVYHFKYGRKQLKQQKLHVHCPFPFICFKIKVYRTSFSFLLSLPFSKLENS